jgi:hypothetical protein
MIKILLNILAMKKFILLLAILSICHNVNSQIDSITYGVSVLNSGPGISLAKINPQTGVVTNISTTPAPYSYPFMGGVTIDPVHKLYYLQVDSLLLSFDLTTGAVANTVVMTYYPGSTTFLNMNYNTLDSTIYGLIQTSSGVILAKLDPQTGIIERISQDTVPGECNSLLGVAIDPVDNILYYVSINSHFTGIDLSTGTAVTSPNIIIDYGMFGPIVFDCYDQTVYGLAGNGTNGRKLAKINVTTGVVTNISDSIISYYIYDEPPTLNPFEGIYYFDRSDSTIIGVSLATGQILTDPKNIPVPGTSFYNIFYNYPCLILPTGIGNLTTSARIDIFPDPAQTYLTIRFQDIYDRLKFIEIFDMQGRKVFQTQTDNDNILLDIENYPCGVYTIKVKTGTANYISKFCKID